MPLVWSRIARQLQVNRTFPVVADKRTAWSGEELLAAVDSLAAALRVRGIASGDRVIIHLENSAEYVACMLACLKLGSIFIPVAFQPANSRQSDILRQSGASAVFINDTDAYSSELVATNQLTSIDVRSTVNAGSKDTRAEPLDETPGRAAYCVFTSGSTGRPKGVVISDESLSHFIDQTIAVFGFNSETRALCISPFHFDGAFGSIFSALAAGGAIIISHSPRTAPIEFIRLCENQNITHTSFSPSYLNILCVSRHLPRLAGTALRTIGLGGEDCSREDLLSLYSSCPSIRVFNRYGPTETTVVVASCELKPDMITSEQKLPIGVPSCGTEFYISGKEGLVLDAEVPGELLIGGVQVMMGYLDDAELTDSVLERDLIPGQILYRSGDLVWRDRLGRYVYLDRLDNVIKRNAVRISLSEITQACLRIDGMLDAVTISQPSATGVKIIAYVVSQTHGETALRRQLSSLLSTEMTPDRVVCIKEIPRMSNGKLDMVRVRNMAAERS
jgi:D-alanine--poly(phosphoribitol) ligase subunit 1